ncbi:TetR/AcrR family transcriptional regulator [Acinetobacter wuhouensis]|uniref:TetR/AcrR family transcriptional regulator n=1 Tax=Acinetobacter wuhouensis TaxID=1879050 RepID=UPI00083A6A4C|nr:TetR/AcrR family transcriptional regulator [Acinetobacter wuhouensis]AXQ23939.1 TetR/AcrR family transcriptional regulator [Acinetobacter wuhouensis]
MRKKEFQPDEIVQAAMQVFWERGYEATSIQDLVEGTGLSRSSLYNTFESKHHLYLDALKCYSSVTAANIAILSVQGQARDLIEQVLMNILHDELNPNPSRGCFAAKASLEISAQDPQIASVLQQNFQSLRQAFAQLISRAQSTGEISTQQDPDALALFFVNTMQGMRILAKGTALPQRQEHLQNVIQTALKLL